MARMSTNHASAAVTMIVTSTFLFSSMDAATKYLGSFMSVVLVLWCRYTIQASIMAVVPTDDADLGSAPPLTSASTIAACPRRAAMNKGVI